MPAEDTGPRADSGGPQRRPAGPAQGRANPSGWKEAAGARERRSLPGRVDSGIGGIPLGERGRPLSSPTGEVAAPHLSRTRSRCRSFFPAFASGTRWKPTVRPSFSGLVIQKSWHTSDWAKASLGERQHAATGPLALWQIAGARCSLAGPGHERTALSPGPPSCQASLVS